MTKGDIDVLCSLIGKKNEYLDKYNDISFRLLIDNVEKFDQLLDIRHGFLLEFNKVTPEIDKVIDVQSTQDQKKLKSMLKYEGLEDIINDDYKELSKKLLEMKSLIASINNKTVQIDERLKSFRQEVIQGMQKLNNSKKVINFMGSTNKADLFKGRSFDQKL